MGVSDSFSTYYNEPSDQHDNFKSLWSVLYAAYQDGRTISQLNSSELSTLNAYILPDFTRNSALPIIHNTTEITPYPPGPTVDPYSWLCMVFYSSPKPNHNQSQPTPLPLGASAINAYPNPSTGFVTFEYELSKGNNIHLLIANLTGQKVFEEQTTGTTGKIIWDTRSVPPGIYIYHAASDVKDLGSGKIIVER